ncbi:SirB2 family protein [Aliikangiella sp. G2MR2-5]|uniref:SirB2 family protein n=1 Tax=Aliikangiella sp. G2MR2-5 TaxID=2788943 RepID=UPI0018A8A1AC
MDYLIIKKIHMMAAGVSFLGFLIRGYWMLIESKLLSIKATKILPHIIDTILLVSAVILVSLSQQYPFVVNWVTAKIVLLVLYILLGTVALKRGKSKKIRIAAFILSLATISAIFAIASLKPAFS